MKRCNRNTEARIEPLERRQMLNAAVLRDGRLTVYCTDSSQVLISVASVFFDGPDAQTFAFRGSAITRIRVLGDGNEIDLFQTYTPNLTDVAIFTGDGGGTVNDYTELHRFNRSERVSIFGGGGNDRLTGGNHTVLMDGGAGNDTLYGGVAGATLKGGDGNDLVSSGNDLLTTAEDELSQALAGTTQADRAPASLFLSGGAGDDVIVGDLPRLAGVTDTLSGGGGNDAFYASPTDQVVDFGVGNDQDLAANQFAGSAQVAQTATLSIREGVLVPAFFPTSGVGNNGPNSKIFVSDSHGTLQMQGPAGSTFTLGDLFHAAGYPYAQVPIPGNLFLIVNGFQSPLSGNQIAGYQINNGDNIRLFFDG